MEPQLLIFSTYHPEVLRAFLTFSRSWAWSCLTSKYTIPCQLMDAQVFLK